MLLDAETRHAMPSVVIVYTFNLLASAPSPLLSIPHTTFQPTQLTRSGVNSSDPTPNLPPPPPPPIPRVDGSTSPRAIAAIFLSFLARDTIRFFAPNSRASAMVRVRLESRETRWTSDVSAAEAVEREEGEVSGSWRGVVVVSVADVADVADVVEEVLDGGSSSGMRERSDDMLRRRAWSMGGSVAAVGRVGSVR